MPLGDESLAVKDTPAGISSVSLVARCTSTVTQVGPVPKRLLSSRKKENMSFSPVDSSLGSWCCTPGFAAAHSSSPSGSIICVSCAITLCFLVVLGTFLSLLDGLLLNNVYQPNLWLKKVYQYNYESSTSNLEKGVLVDIRSL